MTDLLSFAHTTAARPVQNFGAVMAGSNLAVAEVKTRSVPGFLRQLRVKTSP